MSEDSLLNCILENKDVLETPLYVYSTRRLDQSAERLQTLFPKPARLFYSLKANPQAAIVGYFAQKNIRPEVASAGERRISLEAGVSAEEILIGGVSKSASYLREVCNSGCHAVVIDSLGEWERFRRAVPPRRRPNILLRIAPGVPLGGLDMAGSSQFGLSSDQALRLARECGVGDAAGAGLHFYFGSQRLSTGPVVKMLEIVVETLKTFKDEGLMVPVVDLGLGCGVPYLEKDRALDYDLLRGQMQALWNDEVWDEVELWSEAGRALVGEAGYYVSRVTEVKQLHGRSFIFLDGGLNAHNPGVGLGRFLRSNPSFLFVTQSDPDSRGPANLVGNLCTSADLIGHDVMAPRLNEGDLVLIPNSGAYTQTTGLWGFNSQTPFSEMLLDDDGVLRSLQPQYELWLQASRPSDSL